MSIKERIEAELRRGLPVSVTLWTIPGNDANRGQKENVTEFRLDIGHTSEMCLEVREHHARSYSARQKKKMLDTLNLIHETMTQAIAAKRTSIEQFKTSDEEE